MGGSTPRDNPYAIRSVLCGKCRAPIKFVRTMKGARLPIDAAPSDCHNPLAEYHRVGSSDVVAHTSRLTEEERCRHARLYVSHFRTCPYAGEFGSTRRGGGKRGMNRATEGDGAGNRVQKSLDELDELYRVKMEDERA